MWKTKILGCFLAYSLLFACNMLQGAWPSPPNPVDISPAGENSFDPRIAMNPSGAAVAAWVNSDDNAIQGAILSPCSNTWIPTTDLASTGGDYLRVGIDDAGNAVAVWISAGTVMGSTLTAGSTTWVPTNDLSPSLFFPSNLQLDVSAGGDAVAVWIQFSGPDSFIQGSTLAAGSGTWVATTDLSPTTESAFQPQVTIDPAGNAIAVWLEFVGADLLVRGSTLSAGSSVWVPTANLTTASNAEQPRVSVDALGNAVAVWTHYDGANYVMQGARLAAGSGVWVPTTDFSLTGFNAIETSLAVDASGYAVSIWSRNDGSNSIIQGASLAAGSSTWVATNDLSAAGEDAFEPYVVANATGTAVAVWERFNGVDYIIQTANLAPGSTSWTTPVDLSLTDSYQPVVGIDAIGNEVALWSNDEGVNNLVQAATNFVASPFTSTIVATPNEVPANGTTTSLITVTLRNCAGQPIVGHTVALVADGGSSIISAASGPTNASGIVTFTVSDSVIEAVVYRAFDTTDNVFVGQTSVVFFGPSSPTNFRVKVILDPCHRCLRDHILTWSPVCDRSIVSYRVYEGDTVVARTSAKGPFVALITNRDPEVAYTYRLVAVDRAGAESAPVFVSSPVSHCHPSCCCRSSSR